MYFLRLEGQPLKLNYVKNLYGPYADNLRHVLSHIGGHFISGLRRRQHSGEEAEPIHVLPGAVQQAQAVLAEHADTSRIDRGLRHHRRFRVDACSLELLATVHWVMTHDDAAAGSCRGVRPVRTWNNRKARMFTSDHVTTAWTALRDRGRQRYRLAVPIVRGDPPMVWLAAANVMPCSRRGTFNMPSLPVGVRISSLDFDGKPLTKCSAKSSPICSSQASNLTSS